MKRYLVAALAAGAVYAVLGPIFVHFVLDQGMAQELERVVAAIMGRAPAPAGATSGTGWGTIVLFEGMRVLFGFVTVALYVVLARKRSRFRSARLTGMSLWLVLYVALPIVMRVRWDLSLQLLFVVVGYGLIETQIAAHVGAVAWGWRRQGPGRPAGA